MSIENNNRISSFFKYDGGAKVPSSNINIDQDYKKHYFLYADANIIATYLDTIISGISKSESLHFSGLQTSQTPKLQVKVKNDSILIDSTGIYVNENSHRFLCSSLINNSKTLKFNWEEPDDHGTNNINNDSLEVRVDDKTIKTDTENKNIYVDTSGLYDVSFDPRFFRINPPGTKNSGMLTLNIGATSTLIYNEEISRNYC